jgi:nitrite reductase/ring-hydroxylating ferredoxin subunit
MTNRADISDCDMAPSERLDAVLRKGSYFRTCGVQGQIELHLRIRACILAVVESIAGTETRSALAERGLTSLHKYIPAEHIKEIRDQVLPGIRPDLMRLAVAIGEHLLGLEGEFYIDDYTILRINYPFEAARMASHATENPGIGRVSSTTRMALAADRPRDPTYNPTDYHKGLPPAAWAHGPHLDTWSGHSYDGINIWWAIERVRAENSMVFYPGMFGLALEPDPRTLYLRTGQLLHQPFPVVLDAGEMVIFNPEMLHGTHLNVCDETRIALSLRINPGRPRFARSCFYAREFWQSSAAISRGHVDAVVRFPREGNLVDAPPASAVSKRDLTIVEAEPIDAEHALVPARALQAGQSRLNIRWNEDLILVIRRDFDWVAIPAQCPHLGIDLADGYIDEDRIFCPADSVAFDLTTGRSACAALRIEPLQVVSRDDGLVIGRSRLPS